MGVAATVASKDLEPQDSTKKLAQWVDLLGQPLSRKPVFKNFGPESPPSPLTEPGRTRKLISYLTEIDLLNGWQLISNIFPEASYHLIGTVTAWYHMEGNVEIY